MPVHWLTEIEHERLRRFPAFISPLDLADSFTLQEADRLLVLSRYGAANQLGTALQLGALRWLGFVPEAINEAPAEILVFLASQLDLPVESFTGYQPRRQQTRTQHAKTIIEHLGFRRFSDSERKEVKIWLRDRALEHDHPMTLLRLLTERLHSSRIVRPGITELERLVSQARQGAETHIWHTVQPLLTPHQSAALDNLLVVCPDLRQTKLTWLRTGALAATPPEILKSLGKITALRAFGLTDREVAGLNPNRLRVLARIAQTAPNQMLQRMPPRRRYPILLAFLHETLIERIDETLDLCDRCLHDANARAVREMEELRQEFAQATNEKVRLLRKVGSILLDPKVSDADLRKTIYASVPVETLKSAVADCARIERPADDSHFDLLANRYSYLRQFMPQWLDAFEWRGQAGAEGLLQALATVRTVWAEGTRTLPEKPPIAFIPENWRAHVVPDSGPVRKRFYELCLWWELRRALRSGLVWVTGSRRYADPAGFLIPPERWAEVRADACRMMNVSPAPTKRLQTRIDELGEASRTVNELLSESSPVRLDDSNRLILTPLDAETRPPSVAPLERLIAERLPRVNLAELLIETDSWVKFSTSFTHAAHHHRCKFDALPTLYAALLAQSGNFGAARMSHMSGLPEHAIAWMTSWYFREQTLVEASNSLINYHYRLPLSHRWGGGTLSSSDGQRLPVAVKSLTATALPRDFGFGQGLTVYTWTSDQHTQFGTKVIPASLREATVVLDGILGNESDLPLFEHTTDTGGYTEVIFALFDLLGLQFAPRIRDLGSQRLYRTGNISGAQVRRLLKYSLNRDRIEKNWDDLVRLAGTLKLGWAPASLLISKLQAASHKNPLVRALQEYGRLIKTLFILRYLGNEEYRHRIQRQLNKGEALHALRRFLFVANEGQVRKHFLPDQLVQSACLTLVTNAVIVWNTVYMQAAFDQIKQEGILVDEADLQYISPARFEHINVFGAYSFPVQEEFDRKTLRPLRNPNQDSRIFPP